MGKCIVKMEGYECERCDHQWVPRRKKEDPTVCPTCKSPYWDKPKQNK